MSFYFSNASQGGIDTLHSSLQELLEIAIQRSVFDFAITCGFRNEEDQNHAFATRKSTLRWPESRHNIQPANAFDVVPFVDGRADWNSTESYSIFYYLAGLFSGIAGELGIKLAWGGTWRNFKDMPHFQIELD